VSIENLTGPQPIKKFPASYNFRKFITAFKSAHHSTLSFAKSIQSMTSSNFLNIRFNNSLPSTSRFSKWSLSLRSPHRKPLCSCPLSHTCKLPIPPHSCWFDHSSNICRTGHIVKFPVMKSSPVSRYFTSLGPIYQLCGGNRLFLFPFLLCSINHTF